MSGWISTNISYQKSTAENREEGAVYVAFSIASNGTIESCEIAAGVSENSDAVAL